jgi:hypothetical protein
VRDTLTWHEQRPLEQKQSLRAGLTPDREAELLRELRAKPADDGQGA